jgi:hypothetical protein
MSTKRVLLSLAAVALISSIGSHGTAVAQAAKKESTSDLTNGGPAPKLPKRSLLGGKKKAIDPGMGPEIVEGIEKLPDFDAKSADARISEADPTEAITKQ